MLVSVAEPLATACSDALADGGLRVLRVGHIAAACERIPVVMPQLVVVPSTVGMEEAEMLADRCVAVGAEVLRIDPAGSPDAELTRTLKDAANMALIRFLRGGS